MKTRNASLGEKVTGIATAELAGSAAEAGRLLNVPERSIRQWRVEGKKDAEIARLVDKVAAAAKDELIVEVSSMLPALVGFIGKKVKHLIETDAELTPRDLQSLSVTAGIWSDKMELWAKARGNDPYRPDDGGRAEHPDPRPRLLDLMEGLAGKAAGEQRESPLVPRYIGTAVWVEGRASLRATPPPPPAPPPYPSGSAHRR